MSRKIHHIYVKFIGQIATGFSELKIKNILASIQMIRRHWNTPRPPVVDITRLTDVNTVALIYMITLSN